MPSASDSRFKQLPRFSLGCACVLPRPVKSLLYGYLGFGTWDCLYRWAGERMIMKFLSLRIGPPLLCLGFRV